MYATGGSYQDLDSDILTFKYDTAGNQIWNVTYDHKNGDDYGGFGLAVGSSGNVYVTGQVFNGVNDDYILLKYAQK
ncbi:hypothetical protein H6501_03830 [Candidatus Woesearchaeota archaeon]|nr:hypothetical protein [Candidatus Woesearchaeota archaeon]USN43783.1 MAG: hypothetical protein H6500_05320 [Candidatus Woesearchaeota archaeon]